MDNKKIDGMLNTLRKHSPNWADEIRRYINELEYKLLAYRRPIGYSVKNVRLEAKKEVFDDKELMLILCNCDRFDDVHLEGCEYIKQRNRHLSTLQGKGTELLSSGSPDGSPKVCPQCGSKDIHLNHADNDYRCVKCG